MYCNCMDQDEDEYTHQYFRDTQFEGGVGKSLLVGVQENGKSILVLIAPMQ